MEENVEVKEETPKKKGNGSSVVIIIILLLIIGGLGGFIFANKDNLFSKDKDKTEEKDKKKEKEEKKETKLSEKEALSIGQELWDYAYDTFWGGEKVWKKDSNNKCSTTVEEVKAKYAKDFKITDPSYNYSSLDEYVKECGAGARGAIQTYKETKLNVKSIEEDKITFTATSSYCSNSFCNDYPDKPNKIEKEEDHDFIIVKENDNWLIQTYRLPN